MSRIYSKITGIGHYVPENVITNHDLAQWMDTSDAWITERTGIKERRFISKGKDTVANMAAHAANMAMERAGISKEEVDFIIMATITPDYFFPGSGVLLQRELGLERIGALDIRNQCAGFVYALSIADQFIRSGMYRCILVAGAEIQSTAMELSDAGRATAIIFGDGAGVAVVEASDKPGIYSTHLHADGRYAEELIVMDPGSSRPTRKYAEMTDISGSLPYMNGNAVFKHAVTLFPEVVLEALEANGFASTDLDLLIPHQANLRITQAVGQKLGLAPHQVMSNIHKYGNTTAASIPIAMSEAWEEGRLEPGKLVCLASFGSGFAWASALMKW
jgi:3-oxoacyl-[acyl-carrier-protein] synthase-3